MITKYIGQKNAVEALNEELKAFENSEKNGEHYVFRPKAFLGHTGTGKSNLANVFADQLAHKGFNYIEIPINAGWRDIYDVFAKIQSEDEESGEITAIPHVIFMDEVQSQKDDIVDLWKALTTKVTERKVIRRQGRNFLYDPTCHQWLLATNQTIDSAAERRCMDIQVTTYAPNEMRELAELMLCKKHGLKLGDAAFNALLSRCKPLAGDLEKVTGPLVTRAKAEDSAVLSEASVTDVMIKQGFFVGGLRKPDVAILSALTTGAKPVAVLRFTKGVGDDKKSMTQAKVDYLCSAGLVEPVRNAFGLSKAGIEYVKKLAQTQKAKKSAK